MDLRVLIALVAVIVGVGVIVLLWLGIGGGLSCRPSGSTPQITSIEFPKEIQADGQEVVGTVGFKDPDGDIVEARFEVVQAVLFESFRFNPGVLGQREGQFEFYIYTFIPQEVTLRVTLVDQAGHESPPVEFAFQALGNL